MACAGTRRLNPLVALLQQRAARTPDLPALHLRDGPATVTWSWAELWRRVRVAAGGLRRAGVTSGDHLLLVLPEVREAVAGLLGAWAAGAVPMQAGLPFRTADHGDLLDNLHATAARLDARAIVLPPVLAGPATDRSAIPTIASDSLTVGGALLDAPVPAPGPALIQLTSGSLGRPRGVVIPADRLMRHLEAITRALPPGDDATGVSWLPLHHDMGLIGGLLYPLFNGFPLHLLSPADFRRNPSGWIETLARGRATHTAAPPSAYALAARLAPRAVAQGLDLGALRCAMVGAEPIPPAVLRGFTSAYASCGFRADAFFPVYGLAEATVAVTFPEPMTRTRFDGVDRAAMLGDGRPSRAAPPTPSNSPASEGRSPARKSGSPMPLGRRCRTARLARSRCAATRP